MKVSSFCLALVASFVSGFSHQTSTKKGFLPSIVANPTFGGSSISPRRKKFELGFVSGGRQYSLENDLVHARIGIPRGGASHQKIAAQTTPYNTGTKCPVTGLVAGVSSLWGTGGVLYILSKAIQRVLPVAMEPFQAARPPLTAIQLGIYIVTCLWFAYVEGYKGFQQKFSPLVVKRSFTLIPGKNGTRWYHYLLAPLYSMGLIHATRKRQIVSWSVTMGVALLVAAVKRLPYPWRNIVDAGVVAGLTWGSASIAWLYGKSWITGQPPLGIEAELPKTEKTA